MTNQFENNESPEVPNDGEVLFQILPALPVGKEYLFTILSDRRVAVKIVDESKQPPSTQIWINKRYHS